MKKFLVIVAIVVAFLFQTASAEAIQYKKNVVYMVGDAVYVDGKASTKSTVDFGDYDTDSMKTAGSCGQISVTPKQISDSSRIEIAGKAMTLNNVTAAAPKCLKGKFTPTTTKPYITDSGTVSIPGYKAGDKVTVTLTRNYLKKISFNKCGTAKFVSTKTRQIPPTFTYNSKSYTLSKLVDAPAAARCSSTGVSAPGKGTTTADYGLPASAATLIDESWIDDVVHNDADDIDEEIEE